MQIKDINNGIIYNILHDLHKNPNFAIKIENLRVDIVNENISVSYLIFNINEENRIILDNNYSKLFIHTIPLNTYTLYNREKQLNKIL